MEVSGQLHDPAALLPRERAPGSHEIGGWVVPRAVLDAVVNRKIPSPRRESNPRTPIVQPVITDLRILGNWCSGRNLNLAPLCCGSSNPLDPGSTERHVCTTSNYHRYVFRNKTQSGRARFAVFAAVKIQVAVFYVVMPYKVLW
jgi:hypothetical protein